MRARGGVFSPPRVPRKAKRVVGMGFHKLKWLKILQSNQNLLKNVQLSKTARSAALKQRNEQSIWKLKVRRRHCESLLLQLTCQQSKSPLIMQVTKQLPREARGEPPLNTLCKGAW